MEGYRESRHPRTVVQYSDAVCEREIERVRVAKCVLLSIQHGPPKEFFSASTYCIW